MVMLAVFVTGLALSASASSASGRTITEIGNQVTTKNNTTFYCNSNRVAPSTEPIVIGTEGDDIILAMGPDVLEVHGGGGNDTICVMTPGATIFGGPGRDYIYSANSSLGSELLGPEISTIWGGEGDDVIVGGSAMDNISGDEGNDILRGGRGYDYIWGGPGRDLFDGGDNGSQIAAGSSAAGDLCVDIEAPLADMQMNCERWSDDPYADLDGMPASPDEPDVGCLRHIRRPICPFSNFR